MLAKTLSIFIVMVWLWAFPAAACETLSEPQKIEQVLKLIESSDMQFLRNGKAYDGAAARKHMEEKWQYAGNKITTAKQFIHYVGSKSSFTGESYFVHLKDGKEMKSETWLSEQLSIIESNHCASSMQKN